MTEKKEIAFIGPEEYVEAFRLLGMECKKANNSSEAVFVSQELQKQGYELIFVSQDIWEDMPPEPGITVLPTIAKKETVDNISQLIHKALGRKIDL